MKAIMESIKELINYYKSGEYDRGLEKFYNEYAGLA